MCLASLLTLKKILKYVKYVCQKHGVTSGEGSLNRDNLSNYHIAKGQFMGKFKYHGLHLGGIGADIIKVSQLPQVNCQFSIIP